jgi:uncharacterized membrane protein YwaF
MVVVGLVALQALYQVVVDMAEYMAVAAVCLPIMAVLERQVALAQLESFGVTIVHSHLQTQRICRKHLQIQSKGSSEPFLLSVIS